jgi:hypothetical protein
MGKLYNVAMITPQSRAKLEREREQLLAALHQTPNLMRGNVYTRDRKCGRATCECARGGELHKGLQLTVTYKGRTVTRFVRQAELEEVKAMTAAYRELWGIVEELTRVNLELLRGSQAGRRRKTR